ncbi:hypothetical protein HaLaN_22063 [Haematococcus lacustris]|uniref:Uncharacterized protein n=1 Tax=Haematococcus lacustris TaxID=44745 RepID=A0A699ZQV2_HAELA|nr:hypothetical protein HaLaN_22063 [Haematococcus lacustris]
MLGTASALGQLPPFPLMRIEWQLGGIDTMPSVQAAAPPQGGPTPATPATPGLHGQPCQPGDQHCLEPASLVSGQKGHPALQGPPRPRPRPGGSTWDSAVRKAGPSSPPLASTSAPAPPGAPPGAVHLVAPRQSAQQDNADALPPNTTADIALALARIRDVAAATEADARLPAAEGAAGIPDAGSEEGRARGCARPPGPVRPNTMLALLEVAGAVREVAVPEDRDWPAPSAFNDMALHVFPVPQ